MVPQGMVSSSYRRMVRIDDADGLDLELLGSSAFMVDSCTHHVDTERPCT